MQKCVENRDVSQALWGWGRGCSLEVQELRKSARSAVCLGCRAAHQWRWAWRCRRKVRSRGRSPTRCAAIAVLLPGPLLTAILRSRAEDRNRRSQSCLQTSRGYTLLPAHTAASSSWGVACSSLLAEASGPGKGRCAVRQCCAC